jgi:hypothetical protein
MNDFLIEEINLSKAIDALIDHVQELTIELGCVLYDVCRYLPEDTALEIRSMKPQDLNCRLLNNEYYQWYQMILKKKTAVAIHIITIFPASHKNTSFLIFLS